jgi:hypothetical protein
VSLFDPGPAVAPTRRRGPRPRRRPGDGCCEAWSAWVAEGGATDRHVVWLHHLAHRRVAFTEMWLAETAEVPVWTISAAARRARARGWIRSPAFGGMAGKAPEGRGRSWIGALPTR